MTSVAPAGEAGGGGGEGTSTTTATTTTTMTMEQAPSPATASTAGPPQPQQQQHPPPSPLSGCYLLVVLPEPHTAQHKDLILNRLAKGFLSWDKDSCHVDLEKELQALVAQSPEGEEARNGERLIQYATENLVTEVLIYPQSNTLLQCIRNLLASFTKHRHIIHAGYTFGGNGSWILQDGTFSLADFLDAFSEHEVQRVLRAYENSVTVDIHCAGVGDWTTSRLSKEACTRACRVRVNPDDVLTAGVPAITSFVGYIGQYLIPQTLDQLMEPSDVVGNIRFSHPTLYVFPGGQGDAALFGINGFNMLVDGGFARKACFWDFVRHLDRLDAVLVTRINNSNVGGMSSIIRKKKETHVYPQIGHFFCNLVERKHSNSPDGDKDIDPLILNLIDVGQEMMLNLRHINLRPHPCYRDPEPINLYHKVGHGTLDMYVLSPSKDSREVREFMAKWNASDSKLFAGSHRKDSNSLLFPVQNLVSICALLVWQPANPEDTITRILFPGSTPQHKIFEGFERLKHLEFLKRPVCTAKSLSPSTSLATLKEKASILKPKLGSIERETKRLAEMRREKRDLWENKAVKKDSAIDDTTPRIAPIAKPAPPVQQPKTESKAKKVVENKKIESESKESKLIENGMKEMKAKKVEKSEETKKTDVVKAETEKTAPTKESKPQKTESKKKETKEVVKPTAKPTRPDSTIKPSTKHIEKKPKPAGEKKDIMKPSPTTPKKSINGAATKTEITKTATKSTKVLLKASSAVPAKSAKDANNRMVVEQKNIELSSKSAIDSKGKPKTTTSAERKPVTRRAKPLSPSKARLPISPAKSAKSTPSSVKSEKDAVIRKIKGGTTDSSAVSTPSGVDILETGNKLIDRNLTEKSEDMSLDSIESKVLADLKEEREVVEEIEAVLQKAERIEGTLQKFDRDDELVAETADKKDDDVTEEDVTAELDDAPKKISRKESQELTEEDEYLIVEKEEIYTEDSVQSGDTEHKHHLDEVESEKTKIHVEHPLDESEEHEEEKDVDEKKDEVPEKKSVEPSLIGKESRKSVDLSPENKEILKEEMKQIIASATEVVQKTEERDDSGRKDSEDITKEPSSISPEKVDSPGKQDVDQKESVPEKLEESQERISTLESGASTTAPTLPDDERVPLDEIKEEHEKHVSEEVKEKELVKEKEILPEIPTLVASKPEVKILDVKPAAVQGIVRDIVKTPDEVADLPVHEEVDPKLYRMDDIEKDKDMKMSPQETKEPPTPPSKEKDKGVFSFFGKVADKFEKGFDKLTKKARRDSEKDGEDKSSKSSSPKEAKPQGQVPFEDVDMNKVFPKVGKHEETIDPLEKAKQEISDAIHGIDATTALLQEDIKELKLDEKEFGFIEPIQHHDVDKPQELLEEKIEKQEVEAIEAFPKVAKHDEMLDSLEKAKQQMSDAIHGIDATTALLQEDMKELKLDEKEFGFIEPIQHHHADKPQELLETIFKKEEVDAIEAFPTGAKNEEMLDPLEKAKQEMSDAIHGIDATTALLQEDLKELKLAEKEFGFTEPTHHHDVDKPEELLEEKIEKQVGEYVEDVEALMEESSKKFKNVKDSLQDSLESLEDKIDGAKKVVLQEKDTVKDMLTDVAEKLEDMADMDIQDPEKVKFIIPDSEDFEGDDDDTGGPVRDFKEAVRDVAQVLVGTAGIEIEKAEEPKDVEKIVKEVAKVLKEDDFLSEKTLSQSKSVIEETARDMKEQVEEFLQKESIQSVESEPRKLTDAYEEPFTKSIKSKDSVSASIKDHAADLEEAKMLCEDMLKDDGIKEPVIELPVDTRADVLDLGLEEVCVKKIAKREIHEENTVDEDKIIVEPEISFQQNLSPGKAELVTVTPGSTPTSPKLATEAEFSDLPLDYKDMINRDANLEDIIEEFIVQKKHKITMNIIEYIVIVKRVPKVKVINIIQEIIIKHKIPRESVADRIEILRSNDDIPTEKRTQIENDIANEYLSKNTKINSSIVDEIAKNNIISKRIVIEIIEEIIVRRKFPRESAFDISDETYFTIMNEDLDKVPEREIQKQDFLVDVFSIPDSIGVSTKSIHMPPSAEDVDDKIVDGFVSISSKDAVEALLQQEKDSSQKDDFEAVEQEYKVHDVPMTWPTATVADQKSKETEEMTESASDVMEVDEKFVRETVEKSTKKDYVSEAEVISVKKEDEDTSHDIDISEVSEADTKEKYLDEAKEKTSDHKEFEKSTVYSVVDDTKPLDEEKDSQEPVSVKRMVVTASSEDGGQETEICPTGTITFTPGFEDAKIDVLTTDRVKRDTAQSPDSLQSGDASPAESVFSKSPTEKASSHELEFILSQETVCNEAGEIVFQKTETTEITQSEIHSTSHVQSDVADISKSPSVERETSKKESSPKKSIHDEQHETEVKEGSKSPSVEKESHETETSTQKSIHDDHAIEIKDKAKSPSAEAGEKKEFTPEKSTHAEQHAAQVKDRSKSPSVEKESHEKETSPPKSTHDDHAIEIKDKSKSPIAEREEKKESSPEKFIHDEQHEAQVKDRSKSPSVEKETSPPKSIHDDHAIEIKDKSKSPSAETEQKNELSPEKSIHDDHLHQHETEVKEGSKSPSAEKDSHEKEFSPKKSIHDDHVHHAIEAKDKSKSPSVEREEKKESSPEKSILDDHLHQHDIEIKEGSKSPSAEKESHVKETSLSKIIHDVHAIEIGDRSKSPSAEREEKKESSPEKSIHDDQHEAQVKDSSKAPTIEKDSHEKETPPEKSIYDDHIQQAIDVKDRSKSPSTEKDEKEESSPEKSIEIDHIKPQVVDIKDKSKSPSVEKESHEKEASPEKAIHDDHVHHVTEDKDRSKSPSADRDEKKESSPEKCTHEEHDHHKTGSKDRSKSPSVEKSHEKETSPEKSIHDDHVHHLTEDKDRSKSPSVENEEKKESSPAKSTLEEHDHHATDGKDRSKSPSVEKSHEKEASPEKSIHGDHLHYLTDDKDRSKSPSVEKEEKKESSPAKSTLEEHDHHATEGIDRSKSPSVEKSHEKEASPEKSIHDDQLYHLTEDKDRSKSPSVEKEEKKESSPAKSTLEEHDHHATEGKDRSKSPSIEKSHEKEASPEKSIHDDHHLTHHPTEDKDRSKSPSVEKEEKKESSPAKSIHEEHDHHATAGKDRSKSPSVEKSHVKEASPEKSIHDDHVHHVTEDKDRSKSPSVDKEEKKESSPRKSVDIDHAKPIDIDIKDKSRSHSVEKESHEKGASPEKVILDDHKHHEIEVKDRSKSPSADREDKKESSPEKSVGSDHMKQYDVDTKHKSKSPSVEKEYHEKEASPEKFSHEDQSQHETQITDRSKSPSLEKGAMSRGGSPLKSIDVGHVHEEESKDMSQSPSIEKATDVLAAKHVDSSSKLKEVKDGSKSPSMEREEKTEHQIESKDSSKSPSLEKESTSVEKASSPEKSIVDKEMHVKQVKQDTIDFIHFEKVEYSADHTDQLVEPKSPSSEKALLIDSSKSKESSPEKELVTDLGESKPEVATEIVDRSRSSSIVTDISKKETTLEKSTVFEEVKEPRADETREKSKSPSVERDVSHQQDIRSKSPSVEKDPSRRDSVSKKNIDATLVQLDDISRSSSIIADVTKDSESSSKSRSGSIQSAIDHGVSLLSSEKDKLTDEMSRTGSISESAVLEVPTHQSKSPSPEKVDVISEQYSDTFMEKARLSLVSDKFDEDSLDRTKSPSVLSDRSDEKDVIDRSKSPSVAGDKFDVGQMDDSMKEHAIEEKPSAPSLSEIHDKHESEKSKSVSPVGEKIHLEPIGDRKASVSSIESHTDDKGKDRSRSHSLFDTGDKTPLVRSRAASLYDEKLVEKVSLLEHRKDSTGHGKGIFEEEHEFRSSQESLDDIHKDIPRRGSKESDSPSAETKQAIENYILNEYIHKNKVITLACINEITTIYKVDRYVVIKIVNELITSLKLKQEKIVEVDEAEHDEADQKLLDVEENLINYINEEFVLKKKKINSQTIDEIASSKSVPRPLVILVIENIILSRNLRRESVVDFDLCKSQDLLKKDMGADDSTSKSKSSAETIPAKASVKDTAGESKSSSASPGPSPSMTSKSERPEPCIVEEMIISENKREEIESLIVDDYVDRGIKINEAILENIIARTSVPKYIVIEIIQEIIVKKLLSKNMVVDEVIFSDDDLDETPHKLGYKESSHSREYEEHALDKSIPYPDYESPFHKAFMEGMTEIRTTHITTLSGKSTPDLGHQEGSPESSSEVTSTITRTFTTIPGKHEHGAKDKAIGEHHQEDETADRVVILKTTQITTYPEDDQEIIREFVQGQGLSGPVEMYEAEEGSGTREISASIGSKLEHDGDEHEITEIVTTKIVKTIITETEMDPITKITKIISETPSETRTTTTHSKVTSEGTHETIIPTTAVESHVSSSSSKTVVTSSSTIVDSGKSTPDIKHEAEQGRKSLTGKDLMDHAAPEPLEQSVSPVIRDLISDDRSYSGKSSPDVSLPKDIAYGDSTGKSTPELSMSPLIRDGTMIQSHFSGRSTPDKRSENRSRTATPEGFRSGEVIRTIITTTRTISDDGELITTTQEVTETTNEKGETVVLTKKTDVKVDEPPAESLTDEAGSADAHRALSPGSDLAEKDKDPTSPRSDLSSGHSRAATHMWESSEERHTYSDEDPSSPLFSSSPHHPDPRLSTKEESAKPSVEVPDFSSSAMSSSFYGQLPEELAHFTSTLTHIAESHPDQDFTFRKLTVEKEYAGGYAEKDTKKYVDEADLDFEKALTAAAAAAPGSSKELAKPGDGKQPGEADDRKDPLAGWGSPLKLPSPKAPRKFNLRSPIQPTSSADLSPDSLNFDVINDWGEPMRLPSPAPAVNELSNKGSPGTPKKERGEQARKVMSENMKNKKHSESPSKNDKKYKNAKNKVQPVYVDLTYVSHHGNSFYTALDFFKKIRARYYVFSGTEPSREVYDALLEAKKTWEDKDLEVTLIPTYDTDTLGYWVADNEEALAANHIDLSPSASRCTINLQDHETSCSAYRLEF